MDNHPPNTAWPEHGIIAASFHTHQHQPSGSPLALVAAEGWRGEPQGWMRARWKLTAAVCVKSLTCCRCPRPQLTTDNGACQVQALGRSMEWTDTCNRLMFPVACLTLPTQEFSPPCIQSAASCKPFYKMWFSQVSPSKPMVTAGSSTSLFLLETQVSSIKNARLTGKDKM